MGQKRTYTKSGDKSVVDEYIHKYFQTHSAREIFEMLAPIVPNLTQNYVKNRKSWLQDIGDLPKKRKFYGGQQVKQPRTRIEVIGNRTIHRML